MRRIIICFSFFLLSVCACQRVAPENLLIGTWDVTVAVNVGESIFGTPMEPDIVYDNWIFTFTEDGHGSIVDAEDSKTSASFTYIYHQEEGYIDYTMNGSSNKWIIDKLTQDEFNFHREDESDYPGIIADASGSTFIGKRKK